MPRAVRAYVRWVDAMNRYVGLFAMYLVFVMMAILFYSSISKTFLLPANWTLETAQFVMVSYYILGGGYSLRVDSHVRMDLLYTRWSPHTRAVVDAVTVLFLIFFLIIVLYGGISSTEYALKYDERSYSAWAPRMAPIKIVMCAGIVLILLQAVAVFFRNVAEARGEPLP